MHELFTQPAFERLSLALLHFCWQGLLLAGVLGSLFATGLVRQAYWRYLAGLTVLALMAVCPVATFLMSDVPVTDASVTTLAEADANVIPSTPSISGASEGEPAVEQIADFPFVPTKWTATELLPKIQPYVLAIWLMGVTAMAVKLGAGCAGSLWLRRGRLSIVSDLEARIEAVASRLGMTARGHVFGSDRVSQACAIGIWQPMVLLPVSWLTQLPPEAIEAIVAHELAHIRRWDLWVNLLQRVAEALLFYHPALWWVSRRVRLERELCCDELAVAATGKPVFYVRALQSAARLQAEKPAGNLAAAFTGEEPMNLLKRVQHVLAGDAEPDAARNWPAGLVAIGLTSVLLIGLLGMSPAGPRRALADEEREGDRDRRSGVDQERARPDQERVRPDQERVRPDQERVRPDRESDRDRDAEPRDRARERETGRDRIRREVRRRFSEAMPGRARNNDDRRERDADGRRSKFQPGTDREAALYQMILELREEVARLRRDLDAGKRDQPDRSPAGRERPLRDRDRVWRPLDRRRQGPDTGRRPPAPKFDREGGPPRSPGDRGWFKRSGPRDGDVQFPRGPRDGEGGFRRGPRDEDGPPRIGPRDGEGPPRRGPRDAEGPPRRGPRVSDREAPRADREHDANPPRARREADENDGRRPLDSDEDPNDGRERRESDEGPNDGATESDAPSK